MKGWKTMKRNLTKIVKAYEDKYTAKDAEKFYASDLTQLLDMSTTDGKTDGWKLMNNSLNVGFMIGYQTALRDIRKKLRK